MKGKWLWGIIAIGVIFRVFNFEKSFFFAHDQDLYSWIAKDILVNQHQRLVGQLTSVDGVFIGSFYYYLMAFFYWISDMNPLSAVFPIVALAVFNIWSVFVVGKKYFGIRAGYIAALLYAVSFGIARFDRWSVPTLPTLSWSIWFGYVLLELLKGNLRVLPLYGFLCGFVWQLHIALIPILPLPIVSYFVGKNRLSRLWTGEWLKTTIMAILLFAITISPFFLFEIKHNFSQVKSMMAATQKDIGAPSGWLKLEKVIDASGREFQQRLMFGYKQSSPVLYWVAFVVMALLLVIWGDLTRAQALMFGLWYLVIMLAQFGSKRVVSEYYFTNMVPIYIVLLAVFMAKVVNFKLAYILGLLYLLINLHWLVTKTDEDQSYYYRKDVVEFIKSDVVTNNYPCIAVNFIADPGVGVGFRYLFWYNNIQIVKPGTPGVPVYNIPIPWQICKDENPVHYGRFGILLPREVSNMATKEVCDKAENQLDPLLGYTE